MICRTKAAAVQLPDTLKRKAGKVTLDEDRRLSLQSCLKVRGSMLAYKNVITRAVFMGLLKQSSLLPKEEPFLVRIVEDRPDGTLFHINDIKKVVACVLSAWDLLNLDRDSQPLKLQGVLTFLDQRMAGIACVPARCNDWETFKRQASKSQVSPMHIIRMRNKETSTSKISQARFFKCSF
jgi:hypothetical protein